MDTTGRQKCSDAFLLKVYQEEVVSNNVSVYETFDNKIQYNLSFDMLKCLLCEWTDRRPPLIVDRSTVIIISLGDGQITQVIQKHPSKLMFYS